MRTKFVIGSLSFLCACGITASTAGLHLEVLPDTGPFVLGEPVTITIIVTNKTCTEQPFEDQAGGPGRGGLSLKLIHVDTAHELSFNGSMWPPAALVLKPHEAIELHRCLNRLFAIEKDGLYRVSASYEAYVTLVSVEKEKDAPTRQKTVDVHSNVAELTIKPIDEEKIARIKELLESGDDSKIDAAIAQLRGAHPSVIRSCFKTLLVVARKQEKMQKDRLLQFVFSHASFLNEFSSNEDLVMALQHAAASSTDAVRLAAANALGQMRAQGREQRPLRQFSLREVPAWFDREKSAACREALVASLSGDIAELLLKTIRHDSSPQVRLAAVRRFVQLYPSKFKKVGPSLTDIQEQVSIRGQYVSLGDVVQTELDKVRKIIDADAGVVGVIP